MSSKSVKMRTFVMNDDVLGLILCELPIKQLLRLESVSEQFRDCVGYALKRKTGIRLGKKFQNFRCWDQNHSIVGGNIRRSVKCRYNKYDHTYLLDQSLDSLTLIFKKCPNIKSLYLSECRINEEVLQLLVDNCKQLQCLTLVAVFCTNDMVEWKGLTAVLSKLNLKHFGIVGQCYEYDIRNNSSHIQKISPQISYTVSQLPTLERFMTYWYEGDLDTLFCSLPVTLQSLDLIRCSKVSANALSLLNSGNFPYLKELNIDLNFYGRTHESGIFSYICLNLDLDRLSFYADEVPNCLTDLSYTHLKDLKIKFYERYYPIPYNMPDRFMALRSLYLINFDMDPESIYFHQSYPHLRDLTLKNYELRCVCYYDDYSDGESHMIFGIKNYRTECSQCNAKSIQILSRILNLKRLRLFDSHESEIKGFEHFLHLPILDLPRFSSRHRVYFNEDYPYRNPLDRMASIFLKICESRRMNPFALPFIVRSEQKLIEELNQAIIKINLGGVPTNLSLRVREYRNKRFKDYPFM